MNLVSGPFHPALERAFAETLRSLKNGDLALPLAVVAPSQRMADRLKELALEALPRGVAAVRFFNLNSFARSILPADWPVLEDDLAAEKLVLEIAERRFAKAPYLSSASRVPRTARALLSVLHDLKDASVDPDAALRLFVEEIREELAGRGEGRTVAELESPRVAELFSLYHHYDRELRRRKLLDRHDVAAAAAAANFRLPFARVLYYGFYELVQSQLDLLKAVCARVPVTVFFPNGGAYAREFYAEIVRPLATDVTELDPSPAANPVARSYTVSGVRDEVWVAAKEVVRWRDRGVRRIGVVARSLDPYVDHLESVFAAHAIPFTSSAESSMLRDPYVKAARQLLALHERDWSREDVMDFVASPAVRKPEGSNPVLWDLLSRERGVGHGMSEWRARIADAPLRDLLERIFAVGAPPESSWEDFEKWFGGAVAALLGPPPEELASAIGSIGRLSAVRPKPHRGEMLDTLRSLLDRLKRPVGGDAGVMVLDTMAARGIPFDGLVILGMNERVFPRYILQDPFLRDEVRSRLTHRLGNRIPLKTAGYEEEKLLFDLLLASAKEVVLVRQRSDERGRPQVASVFLSTLPQETSVPRRPRKRLEMEMPLTPREASVLEHLRGRTARPLAERRGWPVARLDRAAEFLRVVGKFGPPTKYDGRLGEMDRYFRALAEHGISPTALERLAVCPFQYFARQVLDLEPLDEPEAEESLDASESGQVYHKALELTLKGAERPFERACEEVEATRTIRYPFAWEVLKERMRAALDRFLAADARGDFVPTLFEETLEGEIAGVRFAGRVDRLDLRADGRAFRVIDYKRSRSTKYRVSMKKGIFETKEFLQPPIYFLLAAQRYPKADRAASTALYAFIEEEPSFLSMPDDFAGREEEFIEILRDHLDRIRAGRFGLRVGLHCAHCDFRWMCRKNHIPSRRRAEAPDEE